ncbi:hypothetical protein LXL04_004158 [Taraxacum kok-saghyz]
MDIAEVVSKWTGIPLSNLQQSERDKLVSVPEAVATTHVLFLFPKSWLQLLVRRLLRYTSRTGICTSEAFPVTCLTDLVSICGRTGVCMKGIGRWVYVRGCVHAKEVWEEYGQSWWGRRTGGERDGEH